MSHVAERPDPSAPCQVGSSPSAPRILLPVLLACTLAACSKNGSPADPSVDEDGYVLVWQDEFSGTRIDTDKWVHQNGTGAEYGLDAWGNNELQYYTDRPINSRVEDGHLIIEAHQEELLGQSYTSSRLYTKEQADWTYGRFEVRAQLPKTQGLWPAIWMLPTHNAYGGWPASGEIDIMELVGHTPEFVYGTAHFGNTYDDRNYITGETRRDSGDFSDGFHVYSVEWVPDTLRWYVDGELYHRVVRADVAPYRWPFDQPFHMLLNVAVGGNWPGNPDATTRLPQRMIVDYVRVYQKETP